MSSNKPVTGGLIPAVVALVFAAFATDVRHGRMEAGARNGERAAGGDPALASCRHCAGGYCVASRPSLRTSEPHFSCSLLM